MSSGSHHLRQLRTPKHRMYKVTQDEAEWMQECQYNPGGYNLAACICSLGLELQLLENGTRRLQYWINTIVFYVNPFADIDSYLRFM